MPNQTFFNLPPKKRQLITELSIAEFANSDYESASISNVVKRANIAKGSFYQYFEDKKDLYLYLIDLRRSRKSRFLKRRSPLSLKWTFSSICAGCLT